MTTTAQELVTAASWVLTFDLEKNPLPMNGAKGNYYAAARETKRIRFQTKVLARQAGIPPLGRCTAKLTWYVLTNGRRDVDNLAKLTKAMFDGLVDAGIVPDDIPQLMLKHQAEITKVDRMSHKKSWMELTVTTWPTPVTADDVADAVRTNP